MVYAFNENFVLPLSHDEVVHGKGSLLDKMPGDDWQKFGNLRLLFGYMYAQPGKKLLFMGGEFGQWSEWVHDSQLDWHLTQYPRHYGMQRWIETLNRQHSAEPALHELDCDTAGFEWIDGSDADRSVICFLRKSRAGETILVVCNFTPETHSSYLVGVPWGGYWREVANSDAKEYGGSGQGNLGGVEATDLPRHERQFSLSLTLPPLSTLFFKSQGPPQ
jgi:1,4-alpha-glucan branching enzyme